MPLIQNRLTNAAGYRRDVFVDPDRIAATYRCYLPKINAISRTDDNPIGRNTYTLYALQQAIANAANCPVRGCNANSVSAIRAIAQEHAIGDREVATRQEQAVVLLL